MEVRLQKFLADAGIASRRACEKLIEAGEVKVNGEVVSIQGFKIDPEKDHVEYKDNILTVNHNCHYYMLHKPIGYITTVHDEQDRPTVMELIDTPFRVFPVGRLDFMSSGLLLLTDDGDLTYRLTHPKHDIDKVYIVTISPKISKSQQDYIANGVDLGMVQTSTCKIQLLREDVFTQSFECIIHEGKNRQIRRMFEHVGTRVNRLKRIAIGELSLGDLQMGEYRELTKEEVDYLKEL